MVIVVAVEVDITGEEAVYDEAVAVVSEVVKINPNKRAIPSDTVTDLALK
jgi:hypothetical protein